MAATPNPATILEHCRVAPPDDGGASAEELSLPLTFFDIIWLDFHPIQRLLFYQFPCSETHFLENIVPTFKKSLSQTLNLYIPLAGKIIRPLDHQTLPEIRYVPGDSVSVTVAMCSKRHDFSYLTGNNPRVADEFYAFFPDLPPPECLPESGFSKSELLAVQITLFPDIGICIGFNNNHTIGDASSIVGFVKAWSSIAKFEGGHEFLAQSESLPIFDRSLVKLPFSLQNFYSNRLKHDKIVSLPMGFPTNKVRATYILRKHEIQKLRSFVQAKKPAIVHLSSFTITTAYVWACLVKSAAESGEEVKDDEPEYFGFAVEARQRLSPPVPAAYFGNCVGFALAESMHSELRGDDGFLIAVELIGEVICNKVNSKDALMSDAEEWLSKYGPLFGKRLVGVAGSPKFDLYDVDFGWGKPKKYEAVAIDGDGSMSLSKSREFDGGLEIGLSLPEKKMDSFASIFSDGLKI